MMLITMLLFMLALTPMQVTAPSWSHPAYPWVNSVGISDYLTAFSTPNRAHVFDLNGKNLANVGGSLVSVGGNYVAIAGENRVILLRKGKIVWRKRIEGVDCIAVSRNGDVVVGCSDGKIYYFSREGKLIWEYKAKNAVGSVDVDDNGNFVVAEDLMDHIYFFTSCKDLPWRHSPNDGDLSWIYNTGWCVWKYNRLDLLYPCIIRVSGDGKIIAVGGGGNRMVFVFDRGGYLIAKLKTSGVPTSLSISYNGSLIAVGCDSGYAYLFHNLKKAWCVKMRSRCAVDLSENGKYVVVGDGKAVYLITSGGRVLWKSNLDDSITHVAVSDNGAVIAGGKSTCYIFDPRPEKSVTVKHTSTPKPKEPTPTPKPTETKAGRFSISFPKLPGFRILLAIGVLVSFALIRKRD